MGSEPAPDVEGDEGGGGVGVGTFSFASGSDVIEKLSFDHELTGGGPHVGDVRPQSAGVVR